MNDGGVCSTPWLCPGLLKIQLRKAKLIFLLFNPGPHIAWQEHSDNTELTVHITSRSEQAPKN